jgi:hypothetical protein
MTEVIQSITEIETTRQSDWNDDIENSYEGYRITTDEQEIYLLINSEQSCCERWGYFLCNDELDEFIGATLHSITLTNTALNTEVFWEKAPKATKHNQGQGTQTRREFGSDTDEQLMFVNLQTDCGTLQFVAYNAHNGYYGHAARVESEQLNHKETL